MDVRIFVVIGIIVVSGLFGGLGAYLSARSNETGDASQNAVWKFLTLGVIAAACIPLFLSLVRSSVVTGIFDQVPGESGAFPTGIYESYLILVGLGLIAAFSARRFIDSVTDRLIQRMEQTEHVAARSIQVATSAQEVAQSVEKEAERVDAPDAAPPADASLLESVSDDVVEDATPLSEADRRALMALTKRTYRTLSGIAEDSGISRNRISEMLESLADRNLAQPASSPRTGGARWVITKRGIAALNQPA